MKLSIAELRRRLPVGATFTSTFIGKNSSIARPTMLQTKRRVLKQSARDMVSVITQGEHTGENIWVNWKFVSATVDDTGKVTVYMQEHDHIGEHAESGGLVVTKLRPKGEPEPFVEFTNIHVEKSSSDHSPNHS